MGDVHAVCQGRGRVRDEYILAEKPAVVVAIIGDCNGHVFILVN